MGFFVKKSGKWEVFCKKWTFSQRRVHYLQYQYFLFLHFTYLGGAYAPKRTLPCLRAWIAIMPRFLTGDGVVKTYLMKNDD